MKNSVRAVSPAMGLSGQRLLFTIPVEIGQSLTDPQILVSFMVLFSVLGTEMV